MDNKDKKDWLCILILLLIVYMLCSGCGPVFKKAPRQPLPKESFKSEEHTRKAVQVFVDYFKTVEDKPEYSILANALLTKIGFPTATIKATAKPIKKLADNLLEDKKVMRKKEKTWKKGYDSIQPYEQRPKTMGEKFRSWIFWIALGAVLLFFFAPKVFWNIVFGVKRKIKEGIEEGTKAFEKDHDFKTRFKDETVRAIDKIKEDLPEIWENVQSYFKEEHDADIQKEIKSKRKK